MKIHDIKLHDPNKRKTGLPCLGQIWLLNGMKMLWCSVFSFLFFSLKPTVRKNIWVRTTSIIVMITFLKCHSESYLITVRLKVPSQQLWSTLTNCISNTPYNWGIFGHGSTYLLILSSWLEKTSCNKNQRSCLESYKLHKNSSLYFAQHCTKADHISLIFKRFFFVHWYIG